MHARGSALRNLLNYAMRALSLEATIVALASMAFVLKHASLIYYIC
jgi:hypothetical protein